MDDVARMERKHRTILAALKAEVGVLVLVFVALVVLSMGLDIASRGVQGVISLVFAISTAPLLIAAGLWLDRYEPEPIWLLVRTFLWGAAVAIFIAGWVNSSVEAAAGGWASAVVSAPLVEELLKGMAILWIFRRRREHFTGVLDGVVYALFVGLGFGIVEDIQYYMSSFDEEGVGGLVFTWVLRGLATPFLHPFFTMFIGIAIGLAARPGRNAASRVVLIAGGYAVAVFLHGLWNSGVGVMLYPITYLPAFFLTLFIIRRALQRQFDTLRVHLWPEVQRGTLSRAEYDAIVQPDHRLGAVRRQHLRRVRELHFHAYRFAQLRELVQERARHGKQPPGEADAREADLRRQMAAFTAASG